MFKSKHESKTDIASVALMLKHKVSNKSTKRIEEKLENKQHQMEDCLQIDCAMNKYKLSDENQTFTVFTCSTCPGGLKNICMRYFYFLLVVVIKYVTLMMKITRILRRITCQSKPQNVLAPLIIMLS